jgi:hypothetical protein
VDDEVRDEKSVRAPKAKVKRPGGKYKYITAQLVNRLKVEKMKIMAKNRSCSA